MEIKGENVILIPIKPEEKDEFYKLATETEGSKFWHGEKGKTKWTKDDFFQDWNEDYFEGNFVDRVRFGILKREL